MKATLNDGKEVNVRITAHDYLYIDNLKVSDVKITPINHEIPEQYDSPSVAAAIHKHLHRRWRMI